ncbi:MAG: hypothetical protein AAB309_02895, partial [Deltaproteobacteria bacterium]
MNSLRRFKRQSKFLFFFIGFHWVFFAASLAYGNNPTRDFAREVMERIIELSRPRSLAYSGPWKKCLNEAIQIVRQEKGAVVSNDVIAKVRSFFKTPESAKSYVTLEEAKAKELSQEWLPPKLISDWEAILKLYTYEARPFLEAVRPSFHPKLFGDLSLSSEQRQAILISYYSDEIAREAHAALLKVRDLPEFDFLRSTFEELKEFFTKKMTLRQMMEKTTTHTTEIKGLISEDFIDRVISKLEEGILRGGRGEKK